MMARSVKDAAAILNVVAAKDDIDTNTEFIPFLQLPDFVASCHVPKHRSLRLEVPRNALKKLFAPI
jgi:amidase